MRVIRWFIAAVVIAFVFRLFPLFHIVPLKRATVEKKATAFNAAQFAEKFWNGKLLKSLNRAVNAQVLLPAIQTNPAAAKKKFSRSLGLSNSYTYFLSGTGRVISISGNEISLAVTAGATNAEIVLETGLIFGDAIRDGTGLLNVNDFADSQDFNDIAAQLNKMVETRVQPKLREQAKIGAQIYFTGCAEVDDETSDLKPLKVIPIRTEIR
ncbi:MAG: DUF2291 family protein [Limisphaerales bacterium]